MKNRSIRADADYWRRRAISCELSRKIETPPVLDSEREIEALRARLRAIENSRSWKLTAPLRIAIERLSGIRRRGRKPVDETPLAELDKIQKRISDLSQYTTEDDILDWLGCLQGNLKVPEHQ